MFRLRPVIIMWYYSLRWHCFCDFTYIIYPSLLYTQLFCIEFINQYLFVHMWAAGRVHYITYLLFTFGSLFRGSKKITGPKKMFLPSQFSPGLMFAANFEVQTPNNQRSKNVGHIMFLMKKIKTSPLEFCW